MSDLGHIIILDWSFRQTTVGSTYTLPVLNQLEAVANNPNVQIVALLDRYGNNNSAYYKVQYDANLNSLANYTPNVNYWTKDELNMGNSQTLIDFVTWARTNYPAQHYALILHDHGSGLGGGMWDDTSSGDHLTVSEIGTALASATNNGTNEIDVLYMDACLMGMIEDAYQVRDYVNYYVASQNIKWAFPVPHGQVVSGITATTTPTQLATLFVTTYADTAKTTVVPYTMSATDMSKLNSLVTATNQLAQIISSQMTTSAITLTTVISPTVQRFDRNADDVLRSSGDKDKCDDYIDLYDFARLVKLNFPDSGAQTAAQGVMGAVDQYILEPERHQTITIPFIYYGVGNSRGVSIFFPCQASSFYSASNYDFATGATWPNAPIRAPRRTSATIVWGSMLVNYFQTIYPGGPDNPTPPFPVQQRLNWWLYYLPFISK